MKLPRITLEQWAVFKTVVDEGSFAKAAEELNKSQSSISYIIQNLQQQLPTPVLEIKGRKAELTDAGKTLYRHANNLLDNAANIEQAAAHLALGWETELTIAIDGVMHLEPVLDVIQDFSNQYPQTRIRILETVLSATEEAILEKKADIVLSPKIVPGFLGTPVSTITMMAVAHPAHPIFLIQAPISEAELKQQRQIVIRDSGIKRQQDAGWLGSEQRLTVSHPATSIQAVKAGIGFAFLPQAMIQADLDKGLLKPIELSNQAIRKMPVYLINSKPDTLGPAGQALSKLLLSRFI